METPTTLQDAARKLQRTIPSGRSRLSDIYVEKQPGSYEYGENTENLARMQGSANSK